MVRHEEETGARGDLFPQKPICRTQQTGSRDESRGARAFISFYLRRQMGRGRRFYRHTASQLDNYVLIGIAHDREKMIDALSCNRRRNRLQYFHAGDFFLCVAAERG